MPITQFKRVIFGGKKDITIANFNIGSFTKAVAFDLKEFGQKGIQGMLDRRQKRGGPRDLLEEGRQKE